MENRLKNNSVPNPDGFWYCLDDMGAQMKWAQKTFSNIFFMHILRKKNEIPYIYFRNKIFSRSTNMFSPMESNIVYFQTLSLRHWMDSGVAEIYIL